MATIATRFVMSQRRIIQSELPYFITTNVKDGRWVFQDRRYAESLYRIIRRAVIIKEWSVMAFCILPNHLHLILVPPPTEPGFRNPGSEKANTISDVMHSLKRNFARNGIGYAVWQAGYYARLVTDDVYLENLLNYIRLNYQKMDLPKRFGKHPYVYVSEEEIDRIYYQQPSRGFETSAGREN